MLYCRDCEQWYGEEDDGYGPCNIKLVKGYKRHVTFGGHACDEGL